ncbi:putative glucose-inducible SAM-dependent methyltransferase Rrg1 [Talaromyces proteolyticus]|uniref:Glucose-inducible SAM-dependent methyltransferase Rrg1 n=1 Tax=Talaromyces proteolyticus TaxID=1131652 RepID=A0AAD4KWT0_9EURO|nr:putative glucose-inducible SAM-dependent methyltransferase Rrg1 [Talaromyces proteolyticus]KAH8698643.1 putative glucose-inducible SAM-dependent methyltransferase Rrg1 [Talaromyces proteolyticus]
MITADNGEPLHVLDLPQLYMKPSSQDLLKVLEILTVQPKTFGSVARDVVKPSFQSAEVSRYLTSIISSSLAWFDSDELREVVWDAAAARLSERAGRTAMPALSRVFNIPTSSGEEFALTLHEPSLTADNLGMKTWVSSYLLSRRLHSLFDSVPELVLSDHTSNNTVMEKPSIRALELGSGTGLVGLSFAILGGAAASIYLTDLPAIVPNLAHNVTLNSDILLKSNAEVNTGVLDWSVVPQPAPTKEERYTVILAADPLYSPDHPKWLVQTVETWLSRGLDARVVVELPLRDAYLPQVREFRQRMEDIGLAIVEEGKESGYDDWEGADGGSVEVHCWWSVWGWSEQL